jgi:hypothetical protein
MARIVVTLTAALAAAVMATAAMAEEPSTDGRNLTASFCGSRCISLSFEGQTTSSSSRTDFTLRPGVYWLTVNDNSTFHDYSLTQPDGVDQAITTTAQTGVVTVKINLKHGSYRLFCDTDSHEQQGMYVDFEVGGVGQVG